MDKHTTTACNVYSLGRNTAGRFYLGTPGSIVGRKYSTANPARGYTTTIHNRCCAAETITINVVAGDGFAYDRNIILACLNTLQTTTPHKLIIKTQEPSAYNADAGSWTIWLSQAKPQTTTAHALVCSPCSGNNLPAILTGCRSGCSMPRHTTHRLDSYQASHPGNRTCRKTLVLTLAAIILPQIPASEAAIHDQRVLTRAPHSIDSLTREYAYRKAPQALKQQDTSTGQY